jgi:hypothetical protein
MKKLTIILAMVLAFAQGRDLQAGVVLELSDVVVSAGSTAIVTASISDTSATPSVLSGYNLALDIDTDAVPGFSFAGASAITSLVPTWDNFEAADSFSVQNFDFRLNDSGGGLPLSAALTDLFQIEFMVDAGVSPGTILPVAFNTSPSATAGGITTPQPGLFSFSLNSASVNSVDIPGGLTVDQGSIQVEGAAIPEPSGLVLLLGSVGFAALKRRRS